MRADKRGGRSGTPDGGGGRGVGVNIADLMRLD